MSSTLQLSQDIIKDHGITDFEWKRICELLGREPNYTELGVFSVMWSEHCSYKHSKKYLKTLPTSGSNILIKAGEENAGVVDIGNGWAIVFKIESHNHPSALEPFQGAATGVGGIIRDIFTMGARPIALMNSLRFGLLSTPRVRYLLKGVVGGIAHYGNCIGIPTVGGEIYFDACYDENPLVNAFCLGIAKHTELVRGKAQGVGNSVYYLGATTGRDGIHGATFASEELSEKSEEERSAVQVGDPFLEKLLLEACLELLKQDFVIGIQDMGAAGLTCSTCETASRGDAGIEIDVRKVPLREEGMTPYEILLSESQERMLVIVKKGYEHEVEKIFKKWGLSAVHIGQVTDGDQMCVKDQGKTVVNIPAKALTDMAPVYDPSYKMPEYITLLKKANLSEIPEPKSYSDVLKKLLAVPTIASKKWIYRQYDHMVMTNTVVLPGSDAAVLRIKEADKYIAISTDCNSRFCYLDPYEGTKMAVAESARNVVCSGARPLAITNCLNFGNPEKPEVYWQFVKAIEGMKEACNVFKTPVTGGNVSLYNESPAAAVYPTPVIGMVGLIEDSRHITRSFFKQAGDTIFLLGNLSDYIGASEYWNLVSQNRQVIPPHIQLEHEKKLQEALLQLIHKGLVESAHDISEGGMAVALAECAFELKTNMLGCEIYIEGPTRYDGVLFSEDPSRIIFTSSEANRSKVEHILQEIKFPYQVLGQVKEEYITIKNNQGVLVHELTRSFYDVWSQTIEQQLSGMVS